LVLAVMPAAAQSSGGKPVVGGTLTNLISGEPTSFNNMVVAGAGANGLGAWVYDNLITVDPKTNVVVPRLAASVTPNKDATQWTIKLRPNLKFTDGTPLDAAAVKFNWDRYSAPDSICTCKSSMSGWSWTVVDPRTFQVSTGTPLGGFPGLLGLTVATSNLGEIASPAAIQKYGSQYGSSPETVVGAGPWKLKEWVRNDHMTLVKNDTFWDSPRPYIDTMIAKSVVDQTQKANALQAKQTDAVFMPVLDAALKGLLDSGYPSYNNLNDGGSGVLFNVSSAPLNDVRVRRALIMAMNQKDMILKASSGTAVPVTTYFVKGSPFYDASVKQASYDVAKAQKLIDAYVTEKGGPVSFTLTYADALKDWGVALLQSWAQLKNVNIKGDMQPSTQALSAIRTGNYQSIMAVAPLPATYPETFYQYYTTGLSANVQKVSDPKLDALTASARGDVSQAARKEALDEITKRIIDQAYIAMYNRNTNYTVTQKYVRGVDMKDFNHVQWANMWLAKR
jgi:peptide/nickel transport system substrate-binding protein